MRLDYFLSKHVGAHELCVIREDGFIVATFWIDYEDLFLRHMDRYLGYHEIKHHEWGEIPIAKENGQTINVPCNYIDI